MVPSPHSPPSVLELCLRVHGKQIISSAGNQLSVHLIFMTCTLDHGCCLDRFSLKNAPQNLCYVNSPKAHLISYLKHDDASNPFDFMASPLAGRTTSPTTGSVTARWRGGDSAGPFQGADSYGGVLVVRSGQDRGVPHCPGPRRADASQL